MLDSEKFVQLLTMYMKPIIKDLYETIHQEKGKKLISKKEWLARKEIEAKFNAIS